MPVMPSGDCDWIALDKDEFRPLVVTWDDKHQARVLTCLFARDCAVGEHLHPWAFPDAKGLDKVVALGARWERDAFGWRRVR